MNDRIGIFDILIGGCLAILILWLPTWIVIYEVKQAKERKAIEHQKYVDEGIELMKKKAVTEGAAYWAAGTNGNPVFTWNETVTLFS